MSQKTTFLPVTVLGLGAMGFAIATNLLKKGMSVTGFDVSKVALQRFRDARGHIAPTPEEAVSSADFVVVMVTNATQVTSVLFDEDGAVHGLRQHATIIVSSTVTPDYYNTITSRLGNEFARHDVQVLDCPVSGGVVGATNGTLSIFSSGKAEALNSARLLLDAMGTKVHIIPGGLGYGSKAKMCHQVLPEVDIALCAEAMALAARVGLNTREVYDAVQTSNGSSWIVGDRVRHMIDGDLHQYSVIPNSFKDSVMASPTVQVNGSRWRDCANYVQSIIMQTAMEIHLPMPLVGTALQVYQNAIHSGWTQDDDSTLWRLYLNDHGDDAIQQQTLSSPPIPRDDKFDSQDILEIFVGVHLAASIEAMRFINAIGLDADVMFDIINNAAGSNAQFVQAVPQMRKIAPSLREVDGGKGICEKLRDVVSKANSIGASLPVASAALQVFLMDIAT